MRMPPGAVGVGSPGICHRGAALGGIVVTKRAVQVFDGDPGGAGFEVNRGGALGGDEVARVKAETFEREPVGFLRADDQAAVHLAVGDPARGDRHGGKPGGGIADQGISGAVTTEIGGDVAGRGVEDGFGKQNGAGEGGIVQDLGEEPVRVIHATVEQA